MKIRVACFNNDLSLGGTPMTMQRFVKYLNRDIFAPYICSLQGGPKAEVFRRMGLEVYIIGSDIDKLVKYLEKRSVDIIHIYRYGSEEDHFPILAAREAGVPVVIEHNIFGAIDKSSSGALIDHHLFISKFCAIRYMKMTGMSLEQFWKKSKVLYCGPVDLEELENLGQIERGIIRQKLGLDDQDFVLGRIGRPDPTKWSDTILRVMPKLLEKSKRIKIVILGIPKEAKDRNKDIIRKFKDNLIFLEWPIPIGKEPEFYHIIDALVMITKNGETFGVAISEAMACKKPVIVNSTPFQDNAQVEVVDNGKTGLVAASSDGLVEAVHLLLKNRRLGEAMGIAGYEKVKSQYDAKKLTPILEKIYIETLLEKGVKVDERYTKKYENIEYFPSKEDIRRFHQEYEFKVRNCYGGINFRYVVEMLAYKLILFHLTLTSFRPLMRLLKKTLLPLGAFRIK